ncbi:hypothetical protein [Streptomyces zaomyceticus]|uniref:hypothetical protein n=1 Tax=Streptomyces zaomyceticus TaxID=68286 RepID=UPI002F91A689
MRTTIIAEQRFITTGPGRHHHRPDCTTGFHSRRAVNAEKGTTTPAVGGPHLRRPVPALDLDALAVGQDG